MTAQTDRLRDLHRSGIFVILNAWDVGSARFFQAAGAVAIATTSSGLAATLGLPDQRVNREQLVDHVAALTAALSVPVSVDAEFGYADDDAGLAHTVRLLAVAGAAGLSIEDYDPSSATIIDVESAAHRVGVAARAAAEFGLVLTARAENPLYGVGDLNDTITRLQAYQAAGAEVVYAPGLTTIEDIRRVVTEVDAPVNVLALPGLPPLAELAGAGVRRVSVGGALAWVAYGAAVRAAREVLEDGIFDYFEHVLDPQTRATALS